MYPKQYLILQNCVSSQTFYPNLPIFLHGYIRHIRDISQLCFSLPFCQGCIKEAFSKEIGCRMHWDKDTDKNIPSCSNMTQFRCIYNSVWHLNLETPGFHKTSLSRHTLVQVVTTCVQRLVRTSLLNFLRIFEPSQGVRTKEGQTQEMMPDFT